MSAFIQCQLRLSKIVAAMITVVAISACKTTASESETLDASSSVLSTATQTTIQSFFAGMNGTWTNQQGDAFPAILEGTSILKFTEPQPPTDGALLAGPTIYQVYNNRLWVRVPGVDWRQATVSLASNQRLDLSFFDDATPTSHSIQIRRSLILQNGGLRRNFSIKMRQSFL